ncbi:MULTISPECIES: KAP family P-loop NTPase fold protein [Kluyvera]|uniref:KAP family P-loop NTPase fold protein n=1 Tax=Kluyvera TaxID=579 RepID=UPI0023024AAD|nr:MULTISPECIES: P-loop NTPase fold protein [Kluyvera]MDA8495785.1 KAP family NTPase [Kluyvera georgiana]MDU1198818.1 P-loop NTPase fold protein [Kluyvera ascorbata]
MKTENVLSRAGFDGPVMNAEDDRYGYTVIAEGLARSISALDDNVSTVIGIEGQWGSGKTSLLNLLTAHLKTQVPATTQIVVFSPWVNSPDESPVSALLLTIAARLAKLDTPVMAQAGKIVPLAENILNYAQQTSRRLAPAARFAGKFVPGLELVADGMDVLSETSLSRREKTAAELRADIEDKIAGLGVSFIVVIDDLDRLEPAQAVEVLRMVRSVADFSQFRYVMCYDLDVLAHAVETGLSVQNGKLYLQKIIPLSFSLPRPETFVLRRQFREEAIRLYQTVNGRLPGRNMMAALTSVADTYGAALKTPREIRITINALEFRYASMRDYVYFPDLCFLQLLRTTNTGLYDWVEEYLAERAVVVSGDGYISEEEQKALAESLKTHLSRYFPADAHTVDALSQWVPGISSALTDLPINLFRPESEQEKAMLTAGKRLGSQAYWRYYFAFSAPQNVLQPAILDQIFEVAGHPGKQQELAELLLGYIQSNKLSSRTWFEHILTQLTTSHIESRTSVECRGLLQFFFDYGDKMLERYRAEDKRFGLQDLDTYSVADRLISRMLRDNAENALAFLTEQAQNGRAWYWITQYVRHLLWQHGMAGDTSQDQLEAWMEVNTLETLRDTLGNRLKSTAITDQLSDFPLLNGYIWAWCDISGEKAVREWVNILTQADDAFLKLLLQLRDHGPRSAEGRYRTLNLANMTEIMGDVDQIKARISNIRTKGHYAEQVAQVEQSIAGIRVS